MPTRPELPRLWCSSCAALIAVQLLAVRVLPYEPAVPWGSLFLMLGAAAVTLLAWIAADGRRPNLLIAGAMTLCLLAARGQAELLAGCAAVMLTGFLLSRRKERACVESSPR